MSKGWYGNKMGHSLSSRGIRVADSPKTIFGKKKNKLERKIEEYINGLIRHDKTLERLQNMYIKGEMCGCFDESGTDGIWDYAGYEAMEFLGEYVYEDLGVEEISYDEYSRYIEDNLDGIQDIIYTEIKERLIYPFGYDENCEYCRDN